MHWRKDGTSFPVEYWSHPMYRNGELVGAVVNFVDISERKRMEQALRDSEERYRLISSVTTDLLYSCVQTEAGFFTVDWATASVDRIFGYSLDEILERGCWRCYVHPDDLPEFDRNITHLAAGSTQRVRIAHPRQGWFHPLYPRLFQGGGAREQGSTGCMAPARTSPTASAPRKRCARAKRVSARWRSTLPTGSGRSIPTARHTYSNQRGVGSLGYSADEFLAHGFQ